MERILIVGLDGATFDLIRPWADAGVLPNLAALIKRGFHAPMTSTIPSTTWPAWSSFMTGVNPGKHGIFNFTEPVEGRYAVRFIDSRARSARTIWSLASEAGLRVGVMGVPTTYPPEPVNGFMISGFDSPISTGIDASFVYPRSLYREILDNVGEYKVTDFQEIRIGARWHDMALPRILQTLDRKTEIASYLLDKEPWDVFMVLFGESDTVSHHFWAFHDPDSPRYDPEVARRLGNAIREVYAALDRSVGRLLRRVPEDTTIMIVSDHGFGGTGDKILHLNRWLESLGYLTFRRHDSLSPVLSAARSAALRILPQRVQEAIVRHGPGGIVDAMESRLRFGRIDWGGTLAYSEDQNTLPGVRINLRGREPRGAVNPGRDYLRVRMEIISRLEAWRNPDTHERIVKRAWPKEELYEGPALRAAPDIILELALDRGYAYTILPVRARGEAAAPVRTIDPGERTGSKGSGMNGSHRREGVFIMAGPDIRRHGPADPISIMDAAPTILHLLGRPIPKDLDGRVVEDAFDPASLEVRPPAFSDTPVLTGRTGEPALSAPEAAEIRERLKRLGYLE